MENMYIIDKEEIKMTKNQFDCICKMLINTMENYNFNISHRNINTATLFQGKFFGIYNTLKMMKVSIEYDFDENGFHYLEMYDTVNKFYIELDDLM